MASLRRDDGQTKNRMWKFVPSYKLKVVLTDFDYGQKIEEILNSHKQSEFMDSHTVDVDEATVGSKISRTFRKSVTDSYTWGLN